MKKILNLIRVSLNHDMNLFKINTKNQTILSKVIIPLVLTLYITFVFGLYAKKMISLLEPMHLEFIVLTIFAFTVTIITLIEGIYKSSSLLFNCTDDQLLFSLPIKKETVLFIRLFKFYTFEFLYNALFLIPAIAVYAYVMHPPTSYYLVSVVALFILPIIPIVLSTIIGFIISFLSSKFKSKNIFQTIFTTIFLLLVFYVCYNLDDFLNNIIKNADSINDFIIKLYYPVGVYISLINDFDIKVFLIYIVNHLIIFTVLVYILGKVYFNINSDFKKVLVTHKKNTKYKIKTHSKMVSFVKKELNRFVSTPVFITNAGFGLVLFIIICIFATIKYDSFISTIIKAYPSIKSDYISSNLSIFMFALICFTSFMTSITSSMISLENKSINILKSLPIKSYKIILYKVVAALVIMIPCILIGDLVIFIRFKFDIISIMIILIASILLPLISELIGIMVNLKYPKLDATNDTEVVKQSMSSMISVFLGIGLIAITIYSLMKMLERGISNNAAMLIILLCYLLLFIVLYLILIKTCDKSLNNIDY